MPNFSSYSLYQTCSFEVLWVKQNILAPTVCFKIDLFTTSGSMPLFCSSSLYQTCSVEILWVKKTRFGSYSLFENWFIHDIREYATFLLLQFVPKLFSRSNMSIINVLAPTVCFKIDYFTRSGSIPLFWSYSLYQSCSFEVLWVK